MWQILHGNNVDHLRQFPDNHFNSIVTDPPYGIDFLGKAWDANTGALETYQECLRVLKPGGHILAFSAARTYHHLAVTIEQAGFEIRDQIMWIYSSGFPKSQDIGRQLHKKEHGKPDKQRFDPSIMIKVSGDQYQHPDNGNIYRALPDINGDRLAVSHEGDKYGTVYEQVIEVDNEWSGWGTCLKPAHEPIVLARKPIKLSIAKNCQQWGVGALNIDATRIDWEPGEQEKEQAWREKYTKTNTGGPVFAEQKKNDLPVGGQTVDAPAGRFPSNVIGEIPDYQKYFYCPKVGRAERHIGHETPPPMFGDQKGAYDENGERYAVGLDARGIKTHWQMAEEMGGSLVDHEGNPTRSGNKAMIPGIGEIYTHGLAKHYADWCKANNKQQPNVGNNHPTVKPIELMKYLIRLVTPAGGHVLDPFNGSGSTGCAAVELDMDYTGIELDAAYVEIAQRRIQAWHDATHATTFSELFTDA